MHEFKAKTLRSGSGKKVTDRKQAIAIAMSEAGMKTKPNKSKKPRGGKNPFFGNALPFQHGDNDRWFKDSHPMGKMSFGGGKKKGK